MLIAQISDLHIKAGRRLAYGRVDTAAALEACVQVLNSHAPALDAVIATGDLVDHGRADDYALLRELLAPLRARLCLMPGNHDERGALQAAFPEHAYLRSGPADFVQYALPIGPVRLVVLDSVVPGAPHGELCGLRLDWLDRCLAEAPHTPTLVALHHPPFDTGIAHMDTAVLRKPERLEAVLLRHPQVQRVLCGHLHRPIQALFAGTLAMTCPSPAHQVALDLTPEGPDCFVMEPPGYLLHRWDGRRLVTHQAVIGAFDGPYRFRESGSLID